MFWETVGENMNSGRLTWLMLLVFGWALFACLQGRLWARHLLEARARVAPAPDFPVVSLLVLVSASVGWYFVATSEYSALNTPKIVTEYVEDDEYEVGFGTRSVTLPLKESAEQREVVERIFSFDDIIDGHSLEPEKHSVVSPVIAEE